MSHSPELSISIPPPCVENYVIPEEYELTESPEHLLTSTDPTYIPEHHKTPHVITKAELNDLVRDLGLSKQHAELIGSKVQE